MKGKILYAVMARGRIRSRNLSVPGIPTLFLVFGSALLALAILSLISQSILDTQTFQQHLRPPPTIVLQRQSPDPVKAKQVKLAAAKKQSAFIAKYTNQTSDPDEELRILQKVPALWDTLRPFIWEAENADRYYGCSEPSKKFFTEPSPESNGYLYIVTSGGLNQQRTGITDAVVVAKLLNATLVVPNLDHNSYWKDKSNFSDIFDVDWFISYVAKDIKVIKESLVPFTKKPMYSMRVPRKVKPSYYLSKILPILKRKHVQSPNFYIIVHSCGAPYQELSQEVMKLVGNDGSLSLPCMSEVVRLTKFDYRLTNKLDKDWQKLRCRTNYKALRFTQTIQDIGKTLVDRMRAKSGGHFIALHLRYESDMLAFSGCYYGGGTKEVEELGALRKRWKTLHHHNPERERRNGKCPLTPKEVGLMLRALGYGNDSFLYVASGEVYNGEESLAPLKALFPNFVTKETLTKKKELKPFRKFSSRMAAIDYIVCSQSDVFVTNNNGNMARILAGDRRYSGHKRTIRPNVKKLNHLFPVFQNMSWEEFATQVRKFQKGYMGDPNEVKPGRGEFHENPLVCICAKAGAPPAPAAKKSKGKLGVTPDTSIVNEAEETTEADIADLESPEGNSEEDSPEEDDLPMFIEDEQSGEGDLNVEQYPDLEI